jgi:hypothetical protein
MSERDTQHDKRVADVSLILKDLLKVIKVVSLYPENNPLPQSLRRTFAERLVNLIEEHGDIKVRVERDKLYLGDDSVFTDRSKEESLAGLLFGTGICRLSFKAGLSVTGIYSFLDVIKSHQNSADRTADLAGALWEAAIPGLKIQTVEDQALAEYDGDFRVVEVFQAGAKDTGRNQISPDSARSYDALFEHSEMDLDYQDDQSFISGEVIVDPRSDRSPSDRMIVGDVDLGGSISGTVLDTDDADDNQSLRIFEAVDAMGFGDLTDNAAKVPDTTLILNDEIHLSEEENHQVAELLSADAAFAPYESTAELVKEMLHQEISLDDFYETVTIGEKVTTELIKTGKLTYATDLLRHFQHLEEQVRVERPLWSERLKDALVTAGSRERLSVLKHAMNQYDSIGAVELRGYLNLFGWQALMGVTDMLGGLLHEHHRETISNYLTAHARDNMAVVARGMDDKRPDVVSASIAVLSRIGDDRALAYLKKAIDNPNREIRLLLVTSLQDSPNDDALFLLKKLVFDSDAEVRRTAVASIVARRGQSAFDAVSEIINSESFLRMEKDDQRKILIAYSQLGSDQAVEFLLGLITPVNLLHDATVEFLRDAAFDALAHNRGQRSEKALLKLSANWRPQIKAGAVEALKRRRQFIFGGGNDDQ